MHYCDQYFIILQVYFRGMNAYIINNIVTNIEYIIYCD